MNQQPGTETLNLAARTAQSAEAARGGISQLEADCRDYSTHVSADAEHLSAMADLVAGIPDHLDALGAGTQEVYDTVLNRATSVLLDTNATVARVDETATSWREDSTVLGIRPDAVLKDLASATLGGVLAANGAKEIREILVARVPPEEYSRRHRAVDVALRALAAAVRDLGKVVEDDVSVAGRATSLANSIGSSANLASVSASSARDRIAASLPRS